MTWALALLALTAGRAWAQDAALQKVQEARREAAAVASPVAFEAPARPGPDFGVSSYEVVSVGAYEFATGRVSGAITGVDDDGYMYVWATGGAIPYFVANVTVPAGAVIDYIGLDYCDSNSSAQWLLEALDLFGDHSHNVIGTITPPDRTGCGDAYNSTPFNYATTQNSGRILNLQLFQEGAVDGSLKFAGAEVWFKRRVSPGPSTATFADVPTTSPFFQYVEALASAGIVAGCGGGNYCPSNPVTRGQMAVYLAIALGLHFPQ